MTTPDDLRPAHRIGLRRVAPALGAALGVAVTFLVAPPAAGAAPLPGGRTCATGGAAYVVASGDGWGSIATTLGVTTDALTGANDATRSTVLHPGDQLCVPSGADRAAVARSASRACRKAGGATYVVVPGDGWFRIASRSGVTAAALLAANGASEERVLQPGDELCLPPGARPPSTSSSAGATGASSASGGGQSASGRTSGWSGRLDALPVQGPCWYGDTWHDGRGAGRVHEGVDLITAPGRYVYAVVDGVLTNRAWDQPGLRAGNAWWLTSADGSGTYFFYGHLLDFAPGLKIGSRVEAGEIIGFVGDTGDAATDHLHFEIHPGGGGAINPYPTVKAAGGCNRGTPYRQPSGWVPDTGGI